MTPLHLSCFIVMSEKMLFLSTGSRVVLRHIHSQIKSVTPVFCHNFWFLFQNFCFTFSLSVFLSSDLLIVFSFSPLLPPSPPDADVGCLLLFSGRLWWPSGLSEGRSLDSGGNRLLGKQPLLHLHPCRLRPCH